METVEAITNSLWAPFHDGAAADRLMLPHCIETDRAFWPPSPSSPYVTHGAVEWRAVAGWGVLIAHVTYRRGFQKAFQALLPYGVGLVEFEGGVRLQAHIPNPDTERSPVAGSRVRVAFRALVPDARPVLIVAEGE